MLQEDAGHEAEGVPHVEGSTEVDVLLTSAGMVDLCRKTLNKRERMSRRYNTYVPKPDTTSDPGVSSGALIGMGEM